MYFQAFVDESKVGGLTLFATVVAECDVVAARRAVRGSRAKGAPRLHFTDDSPAVRNAALSIFRRLPLAVVEVDMRSLGDGLEARMEGWQTLVPLLASRGVRRLVVERDQSMELHDKRQLYKVTKDVAGRETPMTYDLVSPVQEPLLWVSDGVAWCTRNRKREWRDKASCLIDQRTTGAA